MITRAQIRRQLRKNGGIMNAVPRQGYFLGKIVKGVKKIVDPAIDVVTNVAKSPVGKAALLGAGLYGLGGGFGPGGFGLGNIGPSIGRGLSAVKSGLFGSVMPNVRAAGMPSFLGETGFTRTGGLLGKLGLTKGGGSMIPTALGGITGASLLTYFMAKGKTEEEAEDLAQDVYRGKGLGMDLIKADMKKYRSGILSASQAHDKGYHFLTPQTYLGAQGGRVGLKKGSPHGKTDKEVLKELYPTLFSDTTTSIEGSPKKKKHTKGKKDGGRIGYQTGGLPEPEWYAEEVEKQRQHWDPTWGPFLMPESWEEMEEPAKVHMMKELGPYYEHKYANPVEPTPTTGGGGGFLGSRIRPADNITSSSTEPTEGLGAIIMEARNRAATPEAPASVSMGQTLEQNIAANQAQQMRNQAILEAGRQRLPQQVAKGGRIGKYGGGIGAAMPRIPTGMPRVNAGGITELDYRQEGGFVPVGVKEKADDVPAMLSKNEFVMTADAVKAAGGGDVEKGAQRMYNTMKQLENRIA
jgi:hypothetical protein